MTYNHVLYILINFLGFLVDFLRGLVDPPGSTVDALLYGYLPDTLDRSLGEVRDTYLIVCDGISQILDEAIQGVDTIGILQKLQQSVFLR